MIGEKLGPYEILASIGSGGMGEVWKARDPRLGRIVAIKKVKEQHSERFKQEARSIAALNHPNICQIHDIGPDYLVLEYVEGKPLSSPLPEPEAIRLAIQIASALEEAHQHGIIHRYLKPSNIMVTEKGSVKVLDFGLAKLYEQDADLEHVSAADRFDQPMALRFQIGDANYENI
jgi:serine/threonine protein kinase